MKKLLSIIIYVLLTTCLFSQSPDKMSYQAVIRNSSDQLVVKKPIGMQISLLQGSGTGSVVYVETHTPTTNANGLVTLEIGAGITSDDFSSIDWSKGPYFIKTEIDPAGGTNYTITTNNQLLSVPYAMHAKTAVTISGTVAETDPFYTSSEAVNISAMDITNLGNLSGTNTGDQDLSTLATKTALADSTALIRSEIPDVSGFLSSETDPVYTSSQAANITATDITNLGNLSGTNTGDQDLSTLALKSNVLGLDNTTAFTPDADYEPATKKYVDDNAPTTYYSVGDFAQGGIVFWVDETGQNGLVCAKEDQSTGVRWYAGTYGNTQAKGDGPFSGEANTSIIIATQVAIGDDNATYAARICNELQITEGGKTYGDWYLPSKEELDLMYQNSATINATATANGGSAFADADYWSSNESDNINAWFQFFATGGQFSSFKYVALNVRAVRSF